MALVNRLFYSCAFGVGISKTFEIDTAGNLTCASSSEPITLQINVGINIDISCQ